MPVRGARNIWARLSAGAVALSLVAVVALPAGSVSAAPRSCPRSINVLDGSWSSVVDAVATVCPGGTVNLGAGTIEWPGRITVDKAVRIVGAGQALTTITSSASSPGIFDITATGVLKLSDVTLDGGRQGLNVAGSLALTRVTAQHFWLTAIWARPGSSVALNSDTLITDNRSGYYDWEGGAGIYNDGGTVILNRNAAVTDNVNTGCYSVWHPYMNRYLIVGGLGGGIFSKNDGSVTLNHQAVVSGNTIQFCDQSKGPGPIGDGGGIFMSGGTLTLSGSARVTGNGAARGGGISTGSGSLFGTESVGATLILKDAATVSGNLATGAGGGIYSWNDGEVFLRDESLVSGNTSHGKGGGVYNVSGTVNMTGGALITENTAWVTGGGLYNATNPYVADSPLGELVQKGGAITGNSPNDIAP